VQHPENTATAIVLRFLGTLGRAKLDLIPEAGLRDLRNSIRDAIGSAVEHEREACARVAEAQSRASPVAQAIRSRRQAGPPPVWRRGESPTFS
jgi:hypothetical protein